MPEPDKESKEMPRKDPLRSHERFLQTPGQVFSFHGMLVPGRGHFRQMPQRVC